MKMVYIRIQEACTLQCARVRDALHGLDTITGPLSECHPFSTASRIVHGGRVQRFQTPPGCRTAVSRTR